MPMQTFAGPEDTLTKCERAILLVLGFGKLLCKQRKPVHDRLLQRRINHQTLQQLVRHVKIHCVFKESGTIIGKTIATVICVQKI